MKKFFLIVKKLFFIFRKFFIYKNINLLNYYIFRIKSKSIFDSFDFKKDKLIKKNNISKNRKVIFIYRSRRKNNASTIMRAFQLQKILNEEGGLNTEIIDESFIKNIKESVCILNKSFLIDASSKEFEELISQGNTLCLDYIDSRETLFQVNYCHCLIASSIKQFKFYQERYKNKLTHLITHHVDPRLTKTEKKFKNLRIGYFGEEKNGLYIDQLKELIYPCYISTKKMSEENWFHEIQNYNGHYIARKINGNNIYKPFLKGFTAAFLNANVIVGLDEGDSTFYLGKDYPYLIKDKSIDGVTKMIKFMQKTFNSRVWFDGLEIMREVKSKSSNKQIIKEFKLMLNSIF